MFGVIGTLFYSGIQEETRTGASIVIVLNDLQTTETLKLFTVASLSTLSGGLATLLILPRLKRRASIKGFSRGLTRLVLFGCAVPLVILFVSAGGRLLRRTDYIAEAVQVAGISALAVQLAIAAVIVLGYITVSAKGAVRFWAVLMLVGYLLNFFGTGSRRLAMAPLLFMVGALLARRTRLTYWALAAAALLSFYLLKLPLYLRGLPEHGVLPYMAQMPGFLDYEVGWESMALNILVSFGIVGATAYQAPPIPTDAFWASVNPLGGKAAGWYEYAADMRLNVYTPYAGVGELGNQGTIHVVIYFVIVGVLLALGDRAVLRLAARGHGIVSLALVGMAGLFFLYSIQYNLRSSTRMLVYGVVIAMVAGMVSRYMVKRRQPAPRQAIRSRVGV
ncbi:hypothetical protein GCM10023081_08720 [Arthrobacter ginkgonis]|uniref:Oligosaccharide repeat unit polymerase n=1 Tax=Arthrobacter ginkgonis TaxID=1630594 RepID=A0ABP7C0F2_9MICC